MTRRICVHTVQYEIENKSLQSIDDWYAPRQSDFVNARQQLNYDLYIKLMPCLYFLPFIVQCVISVNKAYITIFRVLEYVVATESQSACPAPDPLC